MKTHKNYMKQTKRGKKTKRACKVKKNVTLRNIQAKKKMKRLKEKQKIKIKLTKKVRKKDNILEIIINSTKNNEITLDTMFVLCTS